MTLCIVGDADYRKYLKKSASPSENEKMETEAKKEFPLIAVKWRDAKSYDDTYDMNKVFDSCPVLSVGHLKERNEVDTILFRDLYGADPDDWEVSGVSVIPNAWVEHIEYLKREE